MHKCVRIYKLFGLTHVYIKSEPGTIGIYFKLYLFNTVRLNLLVSWARYQPLLIAQPFYTVLLYRDVLVM